MYTLSNSRFVRASVTVLVAIIAAIFLFPLYWMVVLSTHTRSEVYSFPPPFLPGNAVIDNFNRLIEAFNIARTMGNSAMIATVQTILILFFCSLAGFGFARFQQAPGRKWFFNIMLATIMIPGTVGLIPWFVEMKQFHWLDTYWPLIVPSAVSAFGIFWMRQYIEEAIPTELYDAARIDGCSDWRIYCQIVLPLIVPGLSALAALTFLNSWNNFLVPLLVLNDKDLFTLPLGLTSLNGIYVNDTPAIMLGTAIGTLPILIAFIFATRQFIMGLSSGSVKM